MSLKDPNVLNPKAKKRDGNLITGRQNFSGEETARLVVEAVGR